MLSWRSDACISVARRFILVSSFFALDHPEGSKPLAGRPRTQVSYRTDTFLLCDFRAWSKVTNFKPAEAANARR